MNGRDSSSRTNIRNKRYQPTPQEQVAIDTFLQARNLR